MEINISIWWIGCAVLCYFICHCISKARKNVFNVTNVQAELNRIDLMDGFSFERYTGNLLRKRGFKNVQVTKASGDFGADVICRYKNALYVVQCKKYTGNVGPKAVQEIYTAKTYYHATNAAVLTNSYFTKAAIELAGETNVELWDRYRLAEIISDVTMTRKEKRRRALADAVLTSLKIFFGGLSVVFLALYIISFVLTQNPSFIPEVIKKSRSTTLSATLEPSGIGNQPALTILSTPLGTEVINTPVVTINTTEVPTGVFPVITPVPMATYPMITAAPATVNPMLTGVPVTINPMITAVPAIASPTIMVPEQNKVGIMRKTANVREEPSAESKLVGKAMQNEKIIITKPFITEKWHQVMFEGKICYISANYCILQE